MSALAALQRRFLAALLDGAPFEDPGIAIHRRGALASLEGALAAAYPVVRRLVGEAFFAEAARRFARAVPSASGDLHAYGAGFGGFLAAYPPALAVACLPDVARLEWALHECAFAADGARLDAAALARVAPAEVGAIRFRLHPAVRLVASRHPVLSIWEANQPGRDGTPTGAGPEHVLVRRLGHDPLAEPLDAAGWALLDAFARGATLDAACAALGPQAEGRLEALLARLVADGVVAGFDPPG